MQKSDSIKEIAVALVRAQAGIKAAIKDATNPHFKSKYADLGSVVEAVKAPLLKEGVTFLQGVEDADGGVAVETMLLHTSGEWLSSTVKIPATKQDAQGYGSAITYGRRYGLQAMCGVPAEDDDGNAATASAGKGVITASDGVWESLSKDVQDFLTQLVGEVRHRIMAGDVAGAVKHLDAANLGTDEKIAIWPKFDSKERAAMKKVIEASKVKEIA